MILYIYRLSHRNFGEYEQLYRKYGIKLEQKEIVIEYYFVSEQRSSDLYNQNTVRYIYFTWNFSDIQDLHLIRNSLDKSVASLCN